MPGPHEPTLPPTRAPGTTWSLDDEKDREPMSRNTEHAKVLAAIAAQVVQQHRDAGTVPATAPPTVPLASTTSHDPSWDFTIPESYQG